MRGSPNGPCEFWALVDRSAGPVTCWPWTGDIRPNGYAQFSLYGRERSAHAVAAHFARGDSLTGQFDHLCHDPNSCAAGNACPHRRCCNPLHVEQVTAHGPSESSGVSSAYRPEFARGDLVQALTKDVDPPFRVMAIADGYVMLRRPGRYPILFPVCDLRPAEAPR